MIDLTNKYVFVQNKEECERLFAEARKQRFSWYHTRRSLEIHEDQSFPDILYFSTDHTVSRSCRLNPENATQFIMASKLNNDEMTAREFIGYFTKCKCVGTGNPEVLDCTNCILGNDHTKFGIALCSPFCWSGNEDELLSIVAAGEYDAAASEKKAAILLETFMENPCKEAFTDDVRDSFVLAIKKLKGEEDGENV